MTGVTTSRRTLQLTALLQFQMWTSILFFLAPLIGTAAALAGTVLLVTLVITLVVGIRYCCAPIATQYCNGSVNTLELWSNRLTSTDHSHTLFHLLLLQTVHRKYSYHVIHSDSIHFRWHKQKKKGILSHIPVELADIHAARERDSDSESGAGRATDVDNDYYEPVEGK